MTCPLHAHPERSAQELMAYSCWVMKKVFGAKRRPRVLFFAIPGNEVEELEPLCGTAMVIGSLPQVEQSEWDVVVTRQDLPSGLASHLFVLSLGARKLGRAKDMPVGTYVGMLTATVAHEFIVPTNLPEDIRLLVERDLLPRAMESPANRILTPGVASQLSSRKAPEGVRPFLQTAVGETLAGAFLRVQGRAETWFLPKEADSPGWLRLALRHWAELEPERFPEREAWTAKPEWRTVGEEEAVSQLQAIEERRREMLGAIENEEAAAREKVADAQRQAAAGPRRLLTDKGSPLVEAVSNALETLGFMVRDMDEELTKGDRREDLRLTVSEDAEWEAIVEVRGYSGGPKVADLMRLLRFAMRYEREQGRLPSACWYVVNSFVDEDPSERPEEMLSSNPEEVAEFVESYNGLLLDTTDLFKLARSVETGDWKPDEVRAPMLDFKGQFRPATK